MTKPTKFQIEMLKSYADNRSMYIENPHTNVLRRKGLIDIYRNEDMIDRVFVTEEGQKYV